MTGVRCAAGLGAAGLHAAAVGALLATAAVLPCGAAAQDQNIAGSIQAAYLAVPTQDASLEPPGMLFDGFTTEATVKLAVDFDHRFAATVKTCFGCHGFEVDSAYIDFTPFDQLRFRVGRFNPSFGEFPVRRDPANHRTVDKPLPYDMGRMVRMREFNMGVLPAPYVDHGLEVSGTLWFGYTVQLDYAAYVVGGLRGNDDGFDVDWIQTRRFGDYYVDNNRSPAYGGRLALTLDAGDELLFTLGGSWTSGVYDTRERLAYAIAGADAFARLGPLDLRAEYLVRRTEMHVGDAPAERFRYGPGGDGQFDDHALKEGFFVEAILTVVPAFELVGRVDGLRRTGNVPAESPLRYRSAVVRYTGGFNVVLDFGIRLKLAAELYDFSDFDDELALTAAVATIL